MATIEWDQAFTLTSPQGELIFNEATSSPYTSEVDYYLFLLEREKCKAAPTPLRVDTTPVPQGDGMIIHPGFKPGYAVNLGLSLMVGSDPSARAPACGTDLRVMWDTLMLHLNAMYNPSVAELFTGQGRLSWAPSGLLSPDDDRMWDHLRLLEWPVPDYDGPKTGAAFGLATEFPYAVNAAEETTILDQADPIATLVNNGTCEMFPVFNVYGPYDEFTIINNTTGLYITYFAGFPGANAVAAPNWIEINTFRNTAYLNGSVANYKAGIDGSNSDFFPLAPGPNELQFGVVGGSGGTGPTRVEVLWAPAWA